MWREGTAEGANDIENNDGRGEWLSTLKIGRNDIEVFGTPTSNSRNFYSARNEEKFALDYLLIENCFCMKIYSLF
jgi:hypothetical protein